MIRLSGLLHSRKLNDVFTPGGQPSVTYVGREHLGIEARVKRAISQPSIIVSLTGPTKCGKTVLCKSVLEQFEYVWIDGGQIKQESDLWTKVCNELNYPAEVRMKEASSSQGSASGSAGFEAGAPGNKVSLVVTIGGSRLRAQDVDRTYRVDSMQTALEHLLREYVCLVIDDFHYLNEDVRTSVIRTLKGPVFRGLKVILLSTPHRAFEAVKAETEITGRLKHVAVPDWSEADLALIASLGFDALNVDCPNSLVQRFLSEALGNPLLMQRFCWDLCYLSEIREASVLRSQVKANIQVETIFNEVAQDAGLPIYEKLAKGPQSRAPRIMRPLKNGDEVDIYQAILLAAAVTGPEDKLSYDQIRSSLNNILAGKIPQKLEVSNALQNLSGIDREEHEGHPAIDWDDDNADLIINDPFFRFYLRWKVAPQAK